MSVAENLKNRLLSVGIYRDDADALNHEIAVYAAELERLYTDLSVMFRERFIATAQDEGLRAYELLFGPAREQESVEDRRRMLRLRMELGEGDFTPAGIRKALDSFGLTYTISEFPSLNKLNVNAETDYTPAEQAWIRREVAKIIPAHIEFQLTFNTMTWAQWDALDSTFHAIDSEDSTWRQIDNRTE